MGNTSRQALMQEIEAEIRNCSRCPLHQGRIQTVPGTGPLDSQVVFVGEGPGEEEDHSGLPFVGRAGKLLTDILNAVQIPRETVFITNIVKCRPPQNRAPTREEMDLCAPYLMAQLQLIQPKLVVTLGATSLAYLTDQQRVQISQMRGQKTTMAGGITLFPMFHPSYLLRNQSKAPGSPKALTWTDIQEVKRMYDAFRS